MEWDARHNSTFIDKLTISSLIQFQKAVSLAVTVIKGIQSEILNLKFFEGVQQIVSFAIKLEQTNLTTKKQKSFVYFSSISSNIFIIKSNLL